MLYVLFVYFNFFPILFLIILAMFFPFKVIKIALDAEKKIIAPHNNKVTILYNI